MEVILKEDIPSLGYKNDLITVKNGYARNYLIPKVLLFWLLKPAKKFLLKTRNKKPIRKKRS